MVQKTPKYERDRWASPSIVLILDSHANCMRHSLSSNGRCGSTVEAYEGYKLRTELRLRWTEWAEWFGRPRALAVEARQSKAEYATLHRPLPRYILRRVLGQAKAHNEKRKDVPQTSVTIRPVHKAETNAKRAEIITTPYTACVATRHHPCGQCGSKRLHS